MGDDAVWTPEGDMKEFVWVCVCMGGGGVSLMYIGW